jgi:hypothetical protein
MYINSFNMDQLRKSRKSSATIQPGSSIVVTAYVVGLCIGSPWRHMPSWILMYRELLFYYHPEGLYGPRSALTCTRIRRSASFGLRLRIFKSYAYVA